MKRSGTRSSRGKSCIDGNHLGSPALDRPAIPGRPTLGAVADPLLDVAETATLVALALV
jgi:hypothetical protein